MVDVEGRIVLDTVYVVVLDIKERTSGYIVPYINWMHVSFHLDRVNSEDRILLIYIINK